MMKKIIFLSFLSIALISCENNSGQGCTDDTATNYDPSATEDDGSCVYNDPFSGVYESLHALEDQDPEFFEVIIQKISSSQNQYTIENIDGTGNGLLQAHSIADTLYFQQVIGSVSYDGTAFKNSPHSFWVSYERCDSMPAGCVYPLLSSAHMSRKF